MAVLIEGMEMPTEGYIDVRIFCDGTASFAIAKNPYFKEVEAIPVPPHGLIDRERILDSIRIELAQVNAVNDMEDYDSWMRVFDYVRKFPTVIPESEEGEA